MQTGMRAQEAKGYYSEREFDFSKFSAAREQILELGRACIAKGHRNFSVLNLLWAGIAEHARDWGCRYLLGCSSYTTQDEAVGASVWHQLRSEHLAPTEWQTKPHAAFTCGLQSVAEVPPAVPRLLAAYLSLGARLCGPPAIDKDFKTIDFLTWLDLESPRLRALQARGRFLPRGLV
jgi:putative hemolysin